MPITYVMGNGLSIAYKPEYYSLTALTAAVREALAARTVGAQTLLQMTDSILERMSPVPAGAVRSFEDYAGPLERLAGAVTQLADLAMVTGDLELRMGIQKAAELAHDLYVRVVATVLDIATQHINNMGDNTPVRAVAEHLIEAAKRTDEAHVFTLNYDALLDSALLHFYQDDAGRVRADAGFRLVDDAQGNLETSVVIDGHVVSALGWRTDPLSGRATVRLYHLHGAATWLRRRDTQGVVKVRRLQDLRDRDLWNKWADGTEQDLEPVIVLGDRKDRLVTREPFDIQYAYLQTAVAQSDDVIFAGYGFGDAPLNAAVRAALSPATRVWVINPDKGVEAASREALGISGTRLAIFTFAQAGLPEGLEVLPTGRPHLTSE